MFYPQIAFISLKECTEICKQRYRAEHKTISMRLCPSNSQAAKVDANHDDQSGNKDKHI
uniref:Uncharacterized protein n=1 Tax=Oryza brachyantha TaxID=4533 RepID=J3KUV4_ORYBR